MNILHDLAFDEGLMEQLDLDLGDGDFGFFPPGPPTTSLDDDEDEGYSDPHRIDCIGIEGRRYELKCRIDPITRFVIGHALRLVMPDEAIA